MKPLRHILIAALAWPATAMAAGEPLKLKNAEGAELPARLYGRPPDGACPPTIILSPGLAMGEKALTYYATRFEKEGYRAIVLGHGEKSKSPEIKILKNTLLKDDRARTAIFKKRLQDITAALAYAAECKPPFTALFGFSLGAAATMLEAGAQANLPTQGQNRFDAYIAASPFGIGPLFTSAPWPGVTKPLLIVTGTQDNATGFPYKDRTAFYTHLPANHTRMAVVSGAAHNQIGGKGEPAMQTRMGNIMVDFLAMARTGKWLPVSYDNVEISEK